MEPAYYADHILQTHRFAWDAFVRLCHSCGIAIRLEQVSSNDIELNPKKGNTHCERLYKNRYDSTFHAITGYHYDEYDEELCGLDVQL